MMQYQVRVVEKIKEVRTYDVCADSAEEAASEAYRLWICNGDEPPDGVSMSVAERSYEVLKDGAELETFGTDSEDNW